MNNQEYMKEKAKDCLDKKQRKEHDKWRKQRKQRKHQWNMLVA